MSEPGAKQAQDHDGAKVQENVSAIEACRAEVQRALDEAGTHLRDDWAKLEAQWDDLRTRLDNAKNEAAETAQRVDRTVDVAVSQLRRGYERIREQL